MILEFKKITNVFRRPQISPFYFELLDQIISFEQKTKNLSNSEIREKVENLKKAFALNNNDPNIIIESFSLTREVTNRKLGLKHFETQILGGLILNDGKIAEMKTGEGKTLVATLPACFQALSGDGVHIITVNEYLAKRDKELLQAIYYSLGFKVGLICENMEIHERQYNYACDITYTTNSEVGFDYLRDLMVTSNKKRVLRPFNYCLIDEVDSVLIDEAQTPLILSMPKPLASDKYLKALWVAKQLVPNRHFVSRYRTKQVSLTEEGYQFLSEIFETEDLYDSKTPWLAFVENSLKALLFYQRDQDYIIQDTKIQIIDKFTGRVSKDRKWSDGLHQSIECKENVPITSESQTINSITYPKFFSMYKKLSGMTGTAKTSEQEFKEFYNLDVIAVPTRKSICRKDFPDEIFETKKAKFKALIETISYENLRTRPILVGTNSIEESEILAELLKELDIDNYQLLNAKPENSKLEAEIVAQSGLLNSLTIATNMAGRGTDIILGGNLKYLLTSLVKGIIIDIITNNPQQLTFLNIEEFAKLRLDIEIVFKEFSPEDIRQYLDEVNDIETHIPKNPLEYLIKDLYDLLLKKSLESWSHEKNFVSDLGGLLILGTSRNESRRIDNQLRGRAGRQGDPGESKFFISLEDDLVKKYDPNLFLPFTGKNSLEPFSGTELVAITRAYDSLQSRVEKFLYENRKSNSAFEEIYNDYQKLYFAFRTCILEYQNPLNLLLNLYSFNLLDPLNSKLNLSLYSISLKHNTTSIRKEMYDYIYVAGLLSASLLITYNQYIPNYFLEISKLLILEIMDQKWMEFSERISLSRETIGLQAYAQRDPLIQYARLCSKEFSEIVVEIQSLIINSLINSLELNKVYLGA